MGIARTGRRTGDLYGDALLGDTQLRGYLFRDDIALPVELTSLPFPLLHKHVLLLLLSVLVGGVMRSGVLIGTFQHVRGCARGSGVIFNGLHGRRGGCSGGCGETGVYDVPSSHGAVMVDRRRW